MWLSGPSWSFHCFSWPVREANMKFSMLLEGGMNCVQDKRGYHLQMLSDGKNLWSGVMPYTNTLGNTCTLSGHDCCNDQLQGDLWISCTLPKFWRYNKVILTTSAFCQTLAHFIGQNFAAKTPQVTPGWLQAHVRLQYHCSIFAAYLQSVLHVHWTDLQCIREKYLLKCSEVCFEVQRSAYFAALGLHCRRTWEDFQPHKACRYYKDFQWN